MSKTYERFKRFTNTNPIIRPIKWAISHKVQRAFFHSIRRHSDKVRYQVHGMHRTGNHIIINCLMKGRPGNIILCNDLQIGQHPVDSYMKLMQCGKGQPAIISNYEDMPHEKWAMEEYPQWYGRTNAIFQVIILRDPYNLLASRYAWKFPQGKRFREDAAYRQQLVDLWKDHARTYLDWEKRAAEGKVHYASMNYNRWITDRAYREALGKELDLTDPHAGLGDVPDFGGGSSFDGLKQKAVDNKGYTTRFLGLLDQPDFTSLFRDEELIDLADRIFGRLDRVDELLARVHVR